MRLPRPTFLDSTLRPCSVALLLAGAPAAQADAVFEALSAEQLQQVSMDCLAVEFSASEQALRDCFHASASQLSAGTGPALTDAASSVELAATAGLAAHERDRVLRACATSPQRGECASRGAAALQGAPAVDVAAMPLSGRLLALATCAEAPLEHYRRCLSTGEPTPGPASTVETVPRTGAARPNVVAAPTQGPVSDDDVLAGSAAAAPAALQAVADDAAQDGTLIDPPSDAGVLVRMQQAVDGLNGPGRMALIATAMLPILLLLTHLLNRRMRGETTGPLGTRRNPSLVDRVRAPVDTFDDVAPATYATGAQTRDVHSRLGRQADDLFDALDRTQPQVRPQAHPAPHAEPTPTPDEAPTVLVAPPPDLRNTPALSVPAPEHALQPGAEQEPEHEPGPPPRTLSAFGAWLAEQPDPERRRYATELLVYWLAYADERYEPEAAAAVLDDPAPDAATRIKRWVLQNDAAAFADAVRWTVLNSSREQRRQTLDLLIALLVHDAVPTPTQNTLLRFLADCFGLGEAGLQLAWTQGFDAALPALARVDRDAWWQAQDERAMAERDARHIASRSDEERFIARLGLPLHGTPEPARIRAAHRLAVQRCEPGRFDALGERERQLAARQLARFDEARDALLEVMA